MHAQNSEVSRWRLDDRQNEARPVDQATAHIDLPALPVSPRWARRHAAAVLGAWQVDTDIAETALLLVSELVTNAVAALASCASDETSVTPITQTLRHQDDQIAVEIFDPDPRPPVMMRTEPDAESGRGLLLVQALAKEWSWYRLPTGGKIVYFTLAVPARHTQADRTSSCGPPAVALTALDGAERN